MWAAALTNRAGSIVSGMALTERLAGNDTSGGDLVVVLGAGFSKAIDGWPARSCSSPKSTGRLALPTP